MYVCVCGGVHSRHLSVYGQHGKDVPIPKIIRHLHTNEGVKINVPHLKTVRKDNPAPAAIAVGAD